MLGKLIKYDFKALSRILFPLYGAMIVMGLLSSLFMKLSPTELFSNFTIVRIVSILSVVLYVGLVCASVGLSYIIAIYRFKKNLLGFEGYVMNTLPVMSWQNITSKLLTSCIFQVIGIIASLISGFLFFIINSGLRDIDFSLVFSQLGLVLKQYGGTITLYSIEAIILTVIIIATVNLMLFASISIGHSFNDKKVLKSVCAFIGFYILSQIINMGLINITMHLGLNLDAVYDTVYAPQPYIIALTVLELLYGIGYFAVTNYFLNKKLNLQ